MCFRTVWGVKQHYHDLIYDAASQECDFVYRSRASDTAIHFPFDGELPQEKMTD